MSYDLFFFRLADGASLDALNARFEDELEAVLAREEGTATDEELDLLDDDREVAEVLGAVVDQTYPIEALQRDLQRSFLRMTRTHEELDDAMLEFVDGISDEVPPACAEELAFLVEYVEGPGIQPVVFSIDMAEQAIEFAAACLTLLDARRICVFDPQVGYIYDADTAGDLLDEGRESLEEASAAFEDFMRSLCAGDEEDESGALDEVDALDDEDESFDDDADDPPRR